MSLGMPALFLDIPIALRLPESPPIFYKDALKNNVKHGIFRDYRQLTLELSRTEGSSVDFGANFSFEVYCHYCTAGKNRGFGFQLVGANDDILYDKEVARMPTMQKPRQWYRWTHDFAINQSIWDRAEIVRFIAAEDKMLAC